MPLLGMLSESSSVLPAVISVPNGWFFMNWRSNAGKSALIKMLMKEHGFAKRKSEKAVNAVFTCMARALRRGEEVELPIGWIRTASPPANREKRKWQRFRNIQTGKFFRRIARLPDKIIRFRVNPKLIVKGHGPPPPLRAEMFSKGEDLEQLLSQLGFPDVTRLDLGPLLSAADGNLSWLLSRLRTLFKEERKFTYFGSLVHSVQQMYWVRP